MIHSLILRISKNRFFIQPFQGGCILKDTWVLSSVLTPTRLQDTLKCHCNGPDGEPDLVAKRNSTNQSSIHKLLLTGSSDVTQMVKKSPKWRFQPGVGCHLDLWGLRIWSKPIHFLFWHNNNGCCICWSTRNIFKNFF